MVAAHDTDRERFDSRDSPLSLYNDYDLMMLMMMSEIMTMMLLLLISEIYVVDTFT